MSYNVEEVVKLTVLKFNHSASDFMPYQKVVKAIIDRQIGIVSLNSEMPFANDT